VGRVSTRYLVTHPFPKSGIGSNLSSLAGAIWLARKLGRELIVDWRALAHLKDKSLNYFTEFFTPPAIIQGVRVHYAPCPELPDPIDQHPELELEAVAAALGNGDDRPYLVLRAYHGLDRLDTADDLAAQFWMLKDFYSYIQPRDFVQREIDAFAETHFRGAFVVGVNLAGGNGEFAKGQPYFGRVDTDIFSKEATFLRRVRFANRLALSGLPRYLRKSAKIFFATDSQPMRDLLARLPNAVTRRRVFPPNGVGRWFSDYNDPGYTDRDAIVDALTDMFLLSRCQALIRNATVFNQYAQVVTASFNGNCRDLETLYARHWVKVGYRLGKRALNR
jgi:hypothetical protein